MSNYVVHFYKYETDYEAVNFKIEYCEEIPSDIRYLVIGEWNIDFNQFEKLPYLIITKPIPYEYQMLILQSNYLLAYVPNNFDMFLSILDEFFKCEYLYGINAEDEYDIEIYREIIDISSKHKDVVYPKLAEKFENHVNLCSGILYWIEQGELYPLSYLLWLLKLKPKTIGLYNEVGDIHITYDDKEYYHVEHYDNGDLVIDNVISTYDILNDVEYPNLRWNFVRYLEDDHFVYTDSEELDV